MFCLADPGRGCASGHRSIPGTSLGGSWEIAENLRPWQKEAASQVWKQGNSRVLIHIHLCTDHSSVFYVNIDTQIVLLWIGIDLKDSHPSWQHFCSGLPKALCFNKDYFSIGCELAVLFFCLSITTSVSLDNQQEQWTVLLHMKQKGCMTSGHLPPPYTFKVFCCPL